jgi:hypothetical protein
MKIFIIEIRQSFDTETLLGNLFVTDSLDMAITWIKENTDMYKGKGWHFAILQSILNVDESTEIHSYYTNKGEYSEEQPYYSKPYNESK